MLPEGVRGIFLGSCRGLVLSSGRVLFAGYNHTLPKDTMSTTYVWYSDDKGRGTYTLSDGGIRALAETQLAELSGGRVGLFGRSNGQLGCKCQDAALSTDGGAHFGAPTNLTTLRGAAGACQGSIVMSGGGETGWYSGPGSADARADMHLFSTRNGGQSWSPAAAVGSDPRAPAMYSCLESIGTNALGLLWETSAADKSCVGPGCRILFTRLAADAAQPTNALLKTDDQRHLLRGAVGRMPAPERRRRPAAEARAARAAATRGGSEADQPKGMGLNAVDDFGATGSCVYNSSAPAPPDWQKDCTDDGPALQRAIDAAQKQRRALFIPAGDYAVRAPLIVHSNANKSQLVRGDYIYGPLKIVGEGKYDW